MELALKLPVPVRMFCAEVPFHAAAPSQERAPQYLVSQRVVGRILGMINVIMAIIGIMSSCSNSAVCAATADEPEPATAWYSATTDETVYVFVGAWSSTPFTTTLPERPR